METAPLTVTESDPGGNSAEALRASERRYVELLETAPVGVLIVDLDATITQANKTTAQIIGAPSRSLVGLQLATTPFRQTGAWKQLQSVFTTREPTVSEEKWTTQFGKAVWVRLHFAPALCESGELIGALIVFEDIADQKRAEQTNRQAQKLESLSLVAAGLAHNFNNLLQAITGNAELAAHLIDEDSAAHSNLVSIQSAAFQASELTSRMLAFSGKGEKVLQDADLNTVVMDALDQIDHSHRNDATVIRKLHEAPLPIACDVAQVRQVALNLVLNAIEAQEQQDQGHITATTSTQLLSKKDAQTIGFGSPEPGLHLVFTVTDSGCGMDADTVGKLFDPFFTTKFTGRGLGMAAVLGVVKAHRGGISVTTALNKGSTIRVYLPSRLTHMVEPDEAVAATSSPELSNGRLLMIEDDPLVASPTRMLLQRSGFCIVHAPTGEEALKRLESDQDFSCVLLDLTLPDLPGEEVLRRIRTLGFNTPVVVASGHAMSEIEERTAGLNVARLLQKPWTAAQLIESVLAVCEPQSP